MVADKGMLNAKGRKREKGGREGRREVRKREGRKRGREAGEKRGRKMLTGNFWQETYRCSYVTQLEGDLQLF